MHIACGMIVYTFFYKLQFAFREVHNNKKFVNAYTSPTNYHDYSYNIASYSSLE